jgi:DNA-binding NarL/FixJ family response regulator
MRSSDTLTVAIIDDNRLVRDALAAMLNGLPNIRAVPTAAADPSFLEATRPDVLLLDSGLRESDSVHVASTLRAQMPQARIIVMDVIPVPEDVAEFLSIGVAGFLSKDATFDELVATIHGVARGETMLPPRMSDTLFARIAADAREEELEQALADVRLTPRETEVIALISEALSNKEIAQRLGIAPHTVKSHVRNVMEKLELHTRLQIAAYSRREERG